MAIACRLKEEEEKRVVTYKLGSQQQWERKEWEGVMEMVEGDFMGLGHKQLLFLLTTPGTDNCYYCWGQAPPAL